jgi:hypothetical protein
LEYGARNKQQPVIKTAFRRRLFISEKVLFTNLEPIIPSKRKSQSRVLSNILAWRIQKGLTELRAFSCLGPEDKQDKGVKKAPETPSSLDPHGKENSKTKIDLPQSESHSL